MCRRSGSGFVLVMAAALSGCGSGTRVSRRPPPPPPEVMVSQVVSRDVTDFGDYTGRTDSAETVEIRARVNGYLDEIQFTDGQEVKAGDLLFQIDPRPFKADRRECRRAEGTMAGQARQAQSGRPAVREARTHGGCHGTGPGQGPEPTWARRRPPSNPRTPPSAGQAQP